MATIYLAQKRLRNSPIARAWGVLTRVRAVLAQGGPSAVPYGRAAAIALLAGALAVGFNAGIAADTSSLPPSSPDATVERHHYRMTARVRPLLVFWITRSNVGDAVVTRRRSPGESGYTLLIGSDPDRAPRRINRWGYISEEIRGTEASVTGLMTVSDEQSVQEAEARLRAQAAGDHTFKMIRATIDTERARSVVTSLATRTDYTLRQAQTLLDLGQRDAGTGVSRVVSIPPGTRPGLLSALAELMHAQVQRVRGEGIVRPGPALTYVYHGKLYELGETRAQRRTAVTVGARTFTRVIEGDFEIKSLRDRELTRFSLTYGTEGPLSEVPIVMSYQPRWWMQIELVLDDAVDDSRLTGLTP